MRSSLFCSNEQEKIQKESVEKLHQSNDQLEDERRRYYGTIESCSFSFGGTFDETLIRLCVCTNVWKLRHL